ncbi:MAG: SRPBCC domain-containing protein [Thaumarchaeota archaeon]|jgi:uncharacterized protein YndB with AHSA1/START domain|nr:SRPBCC domain-containing protein [Nitrososphaerota archaeon]
MIEPQSEMLSIRRVFAAPPEKVYRAWTDPEALKRWWRVAENWTTSFVEVDLRVGGKFALATKPPAGELHVVRGEYLEIDPQRRLVYTWQVEGKDEETNFVEVQFRSLGENSTELLIFHRQLTKRSAENSEIGWMGVLVSLKSLVET